MANHLAIAAVAKTILKMVEDHCPREEFAATPTFTLYGSHDFGSPQVTEGFSLLVWRIQPSAALRRSQPTREVDGRKRLCGFARFVVCVGFVQLCLLCQRRAGRTAFQLFIQRDGFLKVAGIPLVARFGVQLVGAPAGGFVHRLAAGAASEHQGSAHPTQ